MNFARLGLACLLALSAGAAATAPPGAAGDPIQVDASGPDADVVRLTDAATGRVIARDRLPGQRMRDSLVTPDHTLVAVRYGTQDDGDCLAVYAVVWSTHPRSGAKIGHVARVLSYQPRDGHLAVSLRPVPNGTVVEVRTGRHAPLWSKIFLHDGARDQWLEFPRALAPGDPTQGIPSTVGRTDAGIGYVASLRPLQAPDATGPDAARSADSSRSSGRSR